MKYYIKAKNTKTGKGAIMNTPVFTSKKKAEEFVKEFMRQVPNSYMEVIKDR